MGHLRTIAEDGVESYGKGERGESRERGLAHLHFQGVVIRRCEGGKFVTEKQGGRVYHSSHRKEWRSERVLCCPCRGNTTIKKNRRKAARSTVCEKETPLGPVEKASDEVIDLVEGETMNHRVGLAKAILKNKPDVSKVGGLSNEREKKTISMKDDLKGPHGPFIEKWGTVTTKGRSTGTSRTERTRTSHICRANRSSERGGKLL